MTGAGLSFTESSFVFLELSQAWGKKFMSACL